MLRKAVLALGRPQLFGFQVRGCNGAYMLHSLRKCVHEHACLRHASLQDIGTVCAPAHFAPASIVRRFCAGTGYATGYGPRSWLRGLL